LFYFLECVFSSTNKQTNKQKMYTVSDIHHLFLKMDNNKILLSTMGNNIVPLAKVSYVQRRLRDLLAEQKRHMSLWSQSHNQSLHKQQQDHEKGVLEQIIAAEEKGDALAEAVKNCTMAAAKLTQAVETGKLVQDGRSGGSGSSLRSRHGRARGMKSADLGDDDEDEDDEDDVGGRGGRGNRASALLHRGGSGCSSGASTPEHESSTGLLSSSSAASGKSKNSLQVFFFLNFFGR
jgi:hypothetical protein